MRRKRTLAALVALALVVPLYDAMAAPDFTVLVYTENTWFEHDAAKDPDGNGPGVPIIVKAIQNLGTQNNFAVDWVAKVSDDSTSTPFTDAGLSPYKAVIFAATSGVVFNEAERGAFQRYVQNGGGVVGIHSATATETNWPFFVELIGTSFASHPPGTPSAVVKVADRKHPSTASLPAIWPRSDEWYNYLTNVRGKLHVLATVEESSYGTGSMGVDHPVSWCQSFKGGRAWVTGMGHTDESYSEALFLNHILGGIKWAARNAPGDCGGTVDANFDKVVLDSSISQPMSLAVAPDRRVFFLERGGKVKIFKPSSQSTVVAASLTVSKSYDHGLQGIALDPAFASNGYVYLFYTAPPVSPGTKCPTYDANNKAVYNGGCETNRVSRFTLTGDTLGAEKVLLSYQILPHCCHQGGTLAFDGAGNLLLSTGDDTTAFDSKGFAPIDERAGRDDNDAQKSSANRNDLRGKILRIKPLVTPGTGCAPGQQGIGCTYSIPTGNLFPSNGSNGRPEVYGMGLRNPFRMSVDKTTGNLYVGDVGPDATQDDDSRGPRGYDEINRTNVAANFGWPYCLANNQSYVDYDFALGLSKPNYPHFDCNNPFNDSPNNTGSQSLPAAKPAWIWYPYGDSAAFPEIGSGPSRTAQPGPVYRYDPNLVSETKLPAYYDNTLFIYDWARNWIKEVKLNDDGSILKINPFVSSMPLKSPIDLELGPEGSLYALEWGDTTDYTEYTSVGAQLVRIDYVNGHRTPVAKADVSGPLGGPSPLTVTFSAEGSYDPDPEDKISFAWDFTNDGITDATTKVATYQYPRGNYTAKLTVKDLSNKTASVLLPVASGNSTPSVVIEAPADGRVHRLGEAVPYKVKVTDAEDGSIGNGINCSAISVTINLGHDSHSHPLQTYSGCSGTVQTLDGGHNGDANLYTIITATYKDRGSGTINPVVGSASAYLQPMRKQAEYYASQGCDGSNRSGNAGAYCGIVGQPSPDPLGGNMDIGFTQSGDYISFKRMNLKGVNFLGFRYGAAEAGGRIEVRVDSTAGPKVAEAQLGSTGSWNVYSYATAPVIGGYGGTRDLFFIFKGPLPDSTCDLACNQWTFYLQYDMPLVTINWIDLLGSTAGTEPGALSPMPASTQRILP